MKQSVLEIAKAGVRLVEQGFTRPDDDWVAVMVVRSRPGKVSIAAVEMVEDKKATAVALRRSVEALDAAEVALVTSAWICFPSSDEDALAVRPSRHPDRREVVVITAVDASGVTVELAEIVRRAGSAPRLGEFVSTPANRVTGRFVEALRCGIGGAA